MLDFNRFEVLTFDCYGTLIDWETGILEALRTVLAEAGKQLPDEEILMHYSAIEADMEVGTYRSYKEILRNVMKKFGEKTGFDPSEPALNCLVDSIGSWPPFPDTVASLLALKRKFKLAVLSNIDDNLFSETAEKLEVPFDWVITAEQARAYKPSPIVFELAFEKIDVPRRTFLHIAQSIYHDIVPAKVLGLSTVWVNRRKGKEGTGATPAAKGKPDLEVPDLETLVSVMGLDA